MAIALESEKQQNDNDTNVNLRPIKNLADDIALISK